MSQNSKEDLNIQIGQIEQEMLSADFWQNKDLAQSKIRKLQELKDQLAGVGKFDRGSAIMTIFAGVGGDDAEDFVRMLYEMYLSFCQKNNFQVLKLNENQNSNGGYKTITFEIVGKNVYGLLKNESGVHRLVRISPFNANDKRQTSFAMVEVLPEFDREIDFKIPEDEIEIEFTKSSGPGGQNVNKRETAVRLRHKPTGFTSFVSTERSQAQNKEKALEMLKAKVYAWKQAEEEKNQEIFAISKTVKAEWGSQIRSYVLHPYKMVKDHRTNYESSDVEGILSGEIKDMIEYTDK